MIANGHDSTPRSAAGNSPANEALRLLFNELLTAFNDYRHAPEDDHREGKTERLDASMAQIITFVRFVEAMSDLAPDGINGIPLCLLVDPLRALLDQLHGLKGRYDGSMLKPAERRRGRPSLPLPERLHRASCVAAWRIFQLLGGLSTAAAATRVIRIREEVDSPEVLKQWAKDLRKPDVSICRKFVDEAEQRLQSGEFDQATVLEYAELLLRMPWP
jgi:hypothetical protein